MSRVFDCFTYFNESTFLEFRLKYLMPVVDIFVIAESAFTFTGRKKEFSARAVCERQPAEVRKKIRLLELTDAPKGTASNACNWSREKYQRDALVRGMFDIEEDDLLIIADIDEVPDIKLLPIVAGKMRTGSFPSVVNLSMHMFYYRADNQMIINDQPVIWTHPKLLFSSHLTTPDNIRCSSNNFESTNPVGWHFSYMGGSAQIKKKIMNFSHQEFNKEEILNKLGQNISDNTDIFSRSQFAYREADKDELPQLLMQEHFKDFFFPES